MPLVGKLSPNNKLAQARYLAQHQLNGPETIIFGEKGQIYTGLTNGNIVRVKKDGSVETVVKIGEETNEELCS